MEIQLSISIMQRVLNRHDDVKITIPVPVDERFFSIYVQNNRIEENIFTTVLP